jgi:DNA-binding MarR family transcriptional regulator
VDEVENREREFWEATEPSWALWEVMRGSTDVGHAIARQMGLSYNDVRALELLTQSEHGLGTVELANGLGVRSASATELVDRLEAAGHARRSRHPDDRRRVIVELTEQGRRDALAAMGPLLKRYDVVATEMGPEASATIARYLRAIAAQQREYAEEVNSSAKP